MKRIALIEVPYIEYREFEIVLPDNIDLEDRQKTLAFLREQKDKLCYSKGTFGPRFEQRENLSLLGFA